MDWFDPDTWKLPAQLVEQWQKIAAAVVVIGGAADSIAKWGLAPVRWVGSKLRRSPPRELYLRFVPNDNLSRWSIATAGDRQGTHVHGRWDVTNTSDSNVIILKARLSGRGTPISQVYTQHPEQNDFGSRYPIMAHTISEVTADFSFFPAICSGREPLVADVLFTDNYGEEHVVPSVRFQYIGP
jgi:hypothetical protein